jgi:hypothetical protein
MCADFLSSEGDRILYDEEQVARFRNLLLVDISRGFLNKVNKNKRSLPFEDTKIAIASESLLAMRSRIKPEPVKTESNI